MMTNCLHNAKQDSFPKATAAMSSASASNSCHNFQVNIQIVLGHFSIVICTCSQINFSRLYLKGGVYTGGAYQEIPIVWYHPKLISIFASWLI